MGERSSQKIVLGRCNDCHGVILSEEYFITTIRDARKVIRNHLRWVLSLSLEKIKKLRKPEWYLEQHGVIMIHKYMMCNHQYQKMTHFLSKAGVSDLGELYDELRVIAEKVSSETSFDELMDFFKTEYGNSSKW